MNINKSHARITQNESRKTNRVNELRKTNHINKSHERITWTNHVNDSCGLTTSMNIAL